MANTKTIWKGTLLHKHRPLADITALAGSTTQLGVKLPEKLHVQQKIKYEKFAVQVLPQTVQDKKTHLSCKMEQYSEGGIGFQPCVLQCTDQAGKWLKFGDFLLKDQSVGVASIEGRSLEETSICVFLIPTALLEPYLDEVTTNAAGKLLGLFSWRSEETNPIAEEQTSTTNDTQSKKTEHPHKESSKEGHTEKPQTPQVSPKPAIVSSDKNPSGDIPHSGTHGQPPDSDSANAGSSDLVKKSNPANYCLLPKNTDADTNQRTLATLPSEGKISGGSQQTPEATSARQAEENTAEKTSQKAVAPPSSIGNAPDNNSDGEATPKRLANDDNHEPNVEAEPQHTTSEGMISDGCQQSPEATSATPADEKTTEKTSQKAEAPPSSVGDVLDNNEDGETTPKVLANDDDHEAEVPSTPAVDPLLQNRPVVVLTRLTKKIISNHSAKPKKHWVKYMKERKKIKVNSLLKSGKSETKKKRKNLLSEYEFCSSSDLSNSGCYTSSEITSDTTQSEFSYDPLPTIKVEQDDTVEKCCPEHPGKYSKTIVAKDQAPVKNVEPNVTVNKIQKHPSNECNHIDKELSSSVHPKDEVTQTPLDKSAKSSSKTDSNDDKIKSENILTQKTNTSNEKAKACVLNESSVPRNPVEDKQGKALERPTTLPVDSATVKSKTNSHVSQPKPKNEKMIVKSNKNIADEGVKGRCKSPLEKNGSRSTDIKATSAKIDVKAHPGCEPVQTKKKVEKVPSTYEKALESKGHPKSGLNTSSEYNATSDTVSDHIIDTLPDIKVQEDTTIEVSCPINPGKKNNAVKDKDKNAVKDANNFSVSQPKPKKEKKQGSEKKRKAPPTDKSLKHKGVSKSSVDTPSEYSGSTDTEQSDLICDTLPDIKVEKDDTNEKPGLGIHGKSTKNNLPQKDNDDSLGKNVKPDVVVDQKKKSQFNASSQRDKFMCSSLLPQIKITRLPEILSSKSSSKTDLINEKVGSGTSLPGKSIANSQNSQDSVSIECKLSAQKKPVQGREGHDQEPKVKLTDVADSKNKTNSSQSQQAKKVAKAKQVFIADEGEQETSILPLATKSADIGNKPSDVKIRCRTETVQPQKKHMETSTSERLPDSKGEDNGQKGITNDSLQNQNGSKAVSKTPLESKICQKHLGQSAPLNLPRNNPKPSVENQPKVVGNPAFSSLKIVEPGSHGSQKSQSERPTEKGTSYISREGEISKDKDRSSEMHKETKHTGQDESEKMASKGKKHHEEQCGTDPSSAPSGSLASKPITKAPLTQEYDDCVSPSTETTRDKVTCAVQNEMHKEIKRTGQNESEKTVAKVGKKDHEEQQKPALNMAVNNKSDIHSSSAHTGNAAPIPVTKVPVIQGYDKHISASTGISKQPSPEVQMSGNTEQFMSISVVGPSGKYKRDVQGNKKFDFNCHLPNEVPGEPLLDQAQRPQNDARPPLLLLPDPDFRRYSHDGIQNPSPQINSSGSFALNSQKALPNNMAQNAFNKEQIMTNQIRHLNKGLFKRATPAATLSLDSNSSESNVPNNTTATYARSSSHDMYGAKVKKLPGWSLSDDTGWKSIHSQQCYAQAVSENKQGQIPHPSKPSSNFTPLSGKTNTISKSQQALNSGPLSFRDPRRRNQKPETTSVKKPNTGFSSIAHILETSRAGDPDHDSYDEPFDMPTIPVSNDTQRTNLMYQDESNLFSPNRALPGRKRIPFKKYISDKSARRSSTTDTSQQTEERTMKNKSTWVKMHRQLRSVYVQTSETDSVNELEQFAIKQSVLGALSAVITSVKASMPASTQSTAVLTIEKIMDIIDKAATFNLRHFGGTEKAPVHSTPKDPPNDKSSDPNPNIKESISSTRKQKQSHVKSPEEGSDQNTGSECTKTKVRKISLGSLESPILIQEDSTIIHNRREKSPIVIDDNLEHEMKPKIRHPSNPEKFGTVNSITIFKKSAPQTLDVSPSVKLEVEEQFEGQNNVQNTCGTKVGHSGPAEPKDNFTNLKDIALSKIELSSETWTHVARALNGDNSPMDRTDQQVEDDDPTYCEDAYSHQHPPAREEGQQCQSNIHPGYSNPPGMNSNYNQAVAPDMWMAPPSYPMAPHDIQHQHMNFYRESDGFPVQQSLENGDYGQGIGPDNSLPWEDNSFPGYSNSGNYQQLSMEQNIEKIVKECLNDHHNQRVNQMETLTSENMAFSKELEGGLLGRLLKELIDVTQSHLPPQRRRNLHMNPNVRAQFMKGLRKQKFPKVAQNFQKKGPYYVRAGKDDSTERNSQFTKNSNRKPKGNGRRGKTSHYVNGQYKGFSIKEGYGPDSKKHPSAASGRGDKSSRYPPTKNMEPSPTKVPPRVNEEDSATCGTDQDANFAPQKAHQGLPKSAPNEKNNTEENHPAEDTSSSGTPVQDENLNKKTLNNSQNGQDQVKNLNMQSPGIWPNSNKSTAEVDYEAIQVVNQCLHGVIANDKRSVTIETTLMSLAGQPVQEKVAGHESTDGNVYHSVLVPDGCEYISSDENLSTDSQMLYLSKTRSKQLVQEAPWRKRLLGNKMEGPLVNNKEDGFQGELDRSLPSGSVPEVDKEIADANVNLTKSSQDRDAYVSDEVTSDDDDATDWLRSPHRKEKDNKNTSERDRRSHQAYHTSDDNYYDNSRKRKRPDGRYQVDAPDQYNHSEEGKSTHPRRRECLKPFIRKIVLFCSDWKRWDEHSERKRVIEVWYNEIDNMRQIFMYMYNKTRKTSHEMNWDGELITMSIAKGMSFEIKMTSVLLKFMDVFCSYHQIISEYKDIEDIAKAENYPFKEVLSEINELKSCLSSCAYSFNSCMGNPQFKHGLVDCDLKELVRELNVECNTYLNHSVDIYSAVSRKYESSRGMIGNEKLRIKTYLTGRGAAKIRWSYGSGSTSLIGNRDKYTKSDHKRHTSSDKSLSPTKPHNPELHHKSPTPEEPLISPPKKKLKSMVQRIPGPVKLASTRWDSDVESDKNEDNEEKEDTTCRYQVSPEREKLWEAITAIKVGPTSHASDLLKKSSGSHTPCLDERNLPLSEMSPERKELSDSITDYIHRIRYGVMDATLNEIQNANNEIEDVQHIPLPKLVDEGYGLDSESVIDAEVDNGGRFKPMTDESIEASTASEANLEVSKLNPSRPKVCFSIKPKGSGTMNIFQGFSDSESEKEII